LPIESGVLVTAVEANSAAQRAGLLERDVIVGLDRQPVPGIDDLHRRLTEERIGVKTTLTIIRGSEKLPLEIIPEDRTTAG
jgi:S1-C subfamily serine protease